MATSETGGPNGSQTQNPLSYAKASLQVVKPKKEHAVIIDAVEFTTIDDYLDGLESLTNLSNVRFISKISGKRMCIFLADETATSELVNKTVKIKDENLKIRPLIGKSKRVVISNVNPVIPHEIVLNALKKYGIIPISNINYIKASTSKPGRSHILSFRRQIYIKEEDENSLPESLQITFEETTYWIYLSTDSIRCYECKQFGHSAKQCPKPEEFPELSPQNEHSNAPIKDMEISYITDETEIHASTPDIKNTRGIKRAPPPSTSTENSCSFTEKALQNSFTTLVNVPTLRNSANKSDKFKKPEGKKPRRDKPESFTVPLESIIQSLSKSTGPHTLKPEEFHEFLGKTYGQSNILEISQHYTKNTEALIEMINAYYPHAESSALKARCTRIKKKLQGYPASDSESDYQASELEDQ